MLFMILRAVYNFFTTFFAFDSTGFTLGGYNGINASGESFDYMAFKMN